MSDLNQVIQMVFAHRAEIEKLQAKIERLERAQSTPAPTSPTLPAKMDGLPAALFISRKEAAALLGVCLQTLDRFRREKLVRSRRFGRVVLIERASVQAILYASGAQPQGGKGACHEQP
jgi:hypothetical protein